MTRAADPSSPECFFDVGHVPTTAESSGEAFAARPTVMAIRSRVPTWLEEKIRRLHELRGLQPNWDSYGAARVDGRSIEFADAMLRTLAKLETIEAPTVTASPDGHAVLSWDNGERSLDVDVLPDGRFAYAYLSEGDSTRDLESSTRDLGVLAQLLTGW